MIKQSCGSFPVSIFMAGNIYAAGDICQSYCDDVGFCVTLQYADYIYTGGREDGFVVGLINYPRFPASPFVIQDHAQRLADLLREKLGQDSYSIQTPLGTTWFSWRAENG